MKKYLYLVALSLILFSCSDNESLSKSEGGSTESIPESAQMAVADSASAPMATNEEETSNKLTAEGPEKVTINGGIPANQRLLQIEGTISAEVAKIESTMQPVRSSILEKGGFILNYNVSTENEEQSTEKKEDTLYTYIRSHRVSSLSFRVPKDKIFDIVSVIEKNVTKIVSNSINANDVTIDIQNSIDDRKLQSDKAKDMSDLSKSASKAKDKLTATEEKYIALQRELESKKYQRKEVDKVQFATFSISLSEPSTISVKKMPVLEPDKEKTPWVLYILLGGTILTIGFMFNKMRKQGKEV
jgi:hypothetical protein